MRLYLLEPPSDPTWAPFAGVRAMAELRAGAHRLRDRWAESVGVPVAGVIDDALPEQSDDDDAPVVRAAAVRGPAVVARSDAAVALDRIHPGAARRLTIGGVTVAWILRDGEAWAGPSDEGTPHEIAGLVLRGAYDLVTALEQLLGPDCARAIDAGGGGIPTDALVLGPAGRIAVQVGATVEPGVVFDTRQGAIVVEAGAEVRHGTRLEGPCWIGPGTRVLGGLVRTSALGPRCVVRGEVSTTCFTGYANKAHDGFVGHTILGHWVNLGAGTTTSNLKNTYGTVRLEPAGARVETGRQMLGSLVGDHAKTAIGTMLGTGTVVGAGANVFGGTPGKWVRPFAWGCDGTTTLTQDGFLAIAERVLPRRDVAWTPARAAALTALWRRQAGI